ncbi:hypothetical protein [Candidatus Tisiphia endosymbiont of Nemotelus uliginosus]|uniref:hypothetical protein n=1 Tax=Candidatus Tisiphia endosymbiont of Nemotelus uliginosus TaxID=3077926 RepID=UPI0035C8CA68
MDAPTKPTEPKKGFFKLVIDSIKDTWKNHKKTAGVGLVLAVACFGATGGSVAWYMGCMCWPKNSIRCR